MEQNCLRRFSTSCRIGFLVLNSIFGPAILLFMHFITRHFLNRANIPSELRPFVAFFNYKYFYALVLLCFVLRLIWIYLQHRRTTYELYSDHLIANDRFLNDDRRTISFVDAGEVYQHASLVQKCFGVGNILITLETPSTGEAMRLNNVDDPDDVFKSISHQVAQMKNSLRISNTKRSEM